MQNQLAAALADSQSLDEADRKVGESGAYPELSYERAKASAMSSRRDKSFPSNKDVVMLVDELIEAARLNGRQFLTARRILEAVHVLPAHADSIRRVLKSQLGSSYVPPLVIIDENAWPAEMRVRMKLANQ
jgi:hypothetical protein